MRHRLFDAGAAIPWVLVGGHHEGWILEVPDDRDEVRLVHFGELVPYKARSIVLGQYEYRIGLHGSLDVGEALQHHAAELIRRVRLRPIAMISHGSRPGG
jgi:hypothetical protein